MILLIFTQNFGKHRNIGDLNISLLKHSWVAICKTDAVDVSG